MNFVSPVTATLMCASWMLAAGVPQSSRIESQVRTPIAFEPNVGQAGPEVQWISRNPDRTFLLTSDEARMLLQTEGKVTAIGLKFVGGRSAAATGVDKLASSSNYVLGKNSSEWRGGVPHYGKVRYSNVYDGIDVVYYSADRQLEYDFVLAPGADAKAIQMAYTGADAVRIDRGGDLIISVNGRTLRQLRPKVYQTLDGVRREIAASYRLQAGNRVGFTLGDYDRSGEVVIDPVLQYSTYFGASGYDAGWSITTDQNGDIYMAGHTTSAQLPTSQTAQAVFGGDADAFVAKFSASGSLAWVTYLGGGKTDIARDIAVDGMGNVYVVGNTLSTNFPVRNPISTEATGDFDAFLTKLSSDGRQMLFSTLLGGSFYEDAVGLALGSAGDVYVTGQTTSADFPVRSGFQTGPAGGGGDVFVTKISTTRFSLVYSTYIGGNGLDFATGIAADADGNAYVTGGTTSSIFPVFNPLQTTIGGDRDAFLLKLDPTGRSLVYATYLGGSSEDTGYRVAVDNQRAAYVLGYTNSPNYPRQNPFQATLGGGYDVFVTKVNPAGSALEYSTFLGGSQHDFGIGGITVDAGGSAYVSGYTASANFPTSLPLQLAYGGGPNDVFLARLSPQGNTLAYSTLIGGAGDDYAYGIAVDRLGQVVVAGKTSSANFPQASNAYSGDALGIYDVFLSRVSADASVNFVTVSQSGLTFSVRPGVSPAAQTVSLGASGTALNVTAQSDQPWLRASVDRGTTPATLTVSIDPATLPSTPTASGAITIGAPSAANGPVTIRVTVNQTVVPVITSATPAALTRDTANATVTLNGSGFQNGLSVRINGSTQAATFVNANSIQVVVPGAVRSTAPSLQFIVFNPDGTQSDAFTLPFAGTDVPGSLVVLPSGIVNAASNAVASVIAPGQIILVKGTGFGPATVVNGVISNGALSTSVGGVRLLVDGVPAPILYATQNQIAAIVPYAVADRASALLELEWQGQRSTPIRLNVGGASPAIFTADQSGTGQAAATNQDGSPNSPSNPAAVGSVVSLYATGEGLVSPSGAEGRVVTTERPVLPANIILGGVVVTPEYVGGSPGMTVGLLQVNIRIPAGISGSAVPVILQVGGVASQQGVTIAVR